jgi:hypothetical protein
LKLNKTITADHKDLPVHGVTISHKQITKQNHKWVGKLMSEQVTTKENTQNHMQISTN